MIRRSELWRKAAALAVAVALALPGTPALAWDNDRHVRHHGKHWDGHGKHRHGKHWRGGHHRKHWHNKHWNKRGWWGHDHVWRNHRWRHHHRHKHFRPPVVILPRPHHHFFGPPAIIIRPHGRHHHGYGHHRGHDAHKWIAFTAITLGLLDYLSESQRRAHEQAQVYATTAPVGRPITWRQGSAFGQVVTVRDGESTDGRYCREYQHMVTVGGRREQAYGTACLQPDGSWQMVRMTN